MCYPFSLLLILNNFFGSFLHFLQFHAKLSAT